MDSLPLIGLVVVSYTLANKFHKRYMIELDARQVLPGLIMNTEIKNLKRQIISTGEFLGEKYSGKIGYGQYIRGVTRLNEQTEQMIGQVERCGCEFMGERCKPCRRRLKELEWDGRK